MKSDYEVLNFRNDEWDIEDGVLLKCRMNRYINIESIRIPDGVLKINTEAFSHIVKSIYIPKSVHTICSCAFQGCYQLESIYIDNLDVYLEKGCLYELENLKNVYIGGKRYDVIVTQFYSGNCGAQVYCLERYLGNAKEYHVDDDIKVIGGLAFYNNTTLKKIVLPESVEEIELYAFSCDSDNSLTQVILPDSLKIIGIRAFNNCTSIEEIKRPQAVNFIGKEAFERWESWQKINIPVEFKESKFYQKWRKGCDAEIIYY